MVFKSSVSKMNGMNKVIRANVETKQYWVSDRHTNFGKHSSNNIGIYIYTGVPDERC